MKRLKEGLLAATLLGVAALPAWAHGDHGDHGDVAPLGSGSFLTGFLHPFTGWDHFAAMVAIGL